MKVLFITYYWPPAGGVSAQRILHFVRNLSEQGVECHVIHPNNASYYQHDGDLQKWIPDNAKMHGVDIKDITSLVKKVPKLNAEGNVKSESKGLITKLSKWLRANLFIPDPKANWVAPVVKAASKILESEKFDLVFTNGTPHSVHLSGLRLKKKYNLPWIADFRDPWTKMDYFDKLPLTKRALKKHRILEELVISNADTTLTVSETWKKDFENLGAKKAACITNGYDEAIVRDASANEFIVSHVGSLHGDRSLDAALNAIAKLTKDHGEKVKLALIGNVSSSTFTKIYSVLDKSNLILTGTVNHTEAKAWIAKSSALLLPINNTQDAMGRIPAKLFEYLSSRIPILVLGSQIGDAAEIVKQTNAGRCFDETNESDLYDYLVDIKSGKVEISLEDEKIAQYSRKSTATELKTLIKSLI